MLKKIRHRLGLEPISPYVKRYFRLSNMQSATYMSSIIILLEVWMIVSLFVEMYTGERARSASWFVQHLASYLLLLGAALFLFIHAWKYTHAKITDYKRGTWALVLFSVVAVAFGIYISYLDYVKGEQILTFITMVIFVTCILNWRPLISFLLMTVSFLAFYFVMDFGKDASYATQVNLFITWISLLMASFGTFYQHLSGAEKDEQLEKIALNDELTGIHNMHYFRREAKRILADPATDPSSKRFLFVDIENFKTYNDKYGFREGNNFLILTASILTEVFPDVPVARFSDDHFMILADADNLQERLAIAREKISEKRSEVYLGLKVGSFTPERDTDPAIACDRARYACGSIKKYYEKDYAEYDEALDLEFHKKQYIVNNIDHAIEAGYIVAYYQPVVWSKDRKICGFEALARWEDPEYGFLSPADFIPVLEEYRQIHKLDIHIVEMVCSDIHDALEKYNFAVPVSVNFSFLDFDLTDMLALCNRFTQEYNVPREYLHIEITESVMNSNYELLSHTIGQFRAAGYSLWLDDFGSGYSSLSILKDFQFDVMKIDMQFLTNFPANPKAGKVLESIVRLAKQMEMKTLTEGVETDEQADYLTQIGCERLQGYLFGKPMSRFALSDCLKEKTLTFSEIYLNT
ncbi:MAG: EAL domain-containing protein [Lachnospiraceae bacterium]|nr:EAL domain-containing protein [Lachnospiraceae bacterium]